MRVRAYTSGELLAVLTIVTILGTLAVAGVVKVRARAGLATDLQRARQLGVAIHLYASDFDDGMPPGVNDRLFVEVARGGGGGYLPGMVPRPWATFGNLLGPRVRSREVFQRRVDAPPAVDALPVGFVRCEYLYDEFAGLRARRLGQMPSGSTLLYGDMPRGSGQRMRRTPCVRYDLAARLRSAAECDANTTWVDG